VADAQERVVFGEGIGVTRDRGCARDHRAVRAEVPRLLGPHAEPGAQLQLQAHPRIERRDLGDLGVDVDVLRDPAVVERRHLAAVRVRRFGSDVVLRLAHHAGLADPTAVAAQEAEVVVDRRGGQAARDPALHHRLDVAIRELPWVEVAVRRVMAQLPKEARVQPLPVEHRLERRALVLGAVQVVELLQDRAEYAQVVGRADGQGGKDDVGVGRCTGRRPHWMGVGCRQAVRFRSQGLLC
jgi:hypothetical protein